MAHYIALREMAEENPEPLARLGVSRSGEVSSDDDTAIAS